jgi:hypothetical protein
VSLATSTPSWRAPHAPRTASDPLWAGVCPHLRHQMHDVGNAGRVIVAPREAALRKLSAIQPLSSLKLVEPVGCHTLSLTSIVNSCTTFFPDRSGSSEKCKMRDYNGIRVGALSAAAPMGEAVRWPPYLREVARHRPWHGAHPASHLQ